MKEWKLENNIWIRGPRCLINLHSKDFIHIITKIDQKNKDLDQIIEEILCADKSYSFGLVRIYTYKDKVMVDYNWRTPRIVKR